MVDPFSLQSQELICDTFLCVRVVLFINVYKQKAIFAIEISKNCQFVPPHPESVPSHTPHICSIPPCQVLLVFSTFVRPCRTACLWSIKHVTKTCILRSPFLDVVS